MLPSAGLRVSVIVEVVDVVPPDSQAVSVESFFD